MTERTDNEIEYLSTLLSKLNALSTFLQDEPLPSHETTLPEWHTFLSTMKSILGHLSNDMSFIAGLMAKDYLCSSLPLRDFDVAAKPQGAPGLDIDELTLDGRRVVAEIKTTTPYKIADLGAQQRTSFEKDFAKLNAANAELKYFFLTDKAAFAVVKQKYRSRIPNVTVVLLPQGDDLQPLPPTIDSA